MNEPRKPFPHLLPDFTNDCRFEHHAMNCWMEIFIIGESPDYARQAAQEAFHEIDRLASLLNRHDPGSDPARLERLQPNATLNLAYDSFFCIWLARELFQNTDGAFDVTLGYAREPGKPPTFPFDLAALENQAGARFFEAHRTDGVTRPPVMDLGGIGKGYGLDKAAEILHDWNIPSFLLHAGGSTFLAGGKSQQTSWPIGLGFTTGKTASPWVCQLRQGAVSGSGFDLQPDHILDPHTRTPAREHRNAWSWSTQAALADALSTAFVVMEDAAIAALCHDSGFCAGLTAAGTPEKTDYCWHGKWPAVRKQSEHSHDSFSQ